MNMIKLTMEPSWTSRPYSNNIVPDQSDRRTREDLNVQMLILYTGCVNICHQTYIAVGMR